MSATVVAPGTLERKAKKKDGTVLATYWIVHSADGKMRMTLAWMSSEASGPRHRVAIHDRQQAVQLFQEREHNPKSRTSGAPGAKQINRLRRWLDMCYRFRQGLLGNKTQNGEAM